MKGLGTVAGMGVLYWIAVGAATALVFSAIFGAILVAAVLFWLAKFVIRRFEDATPRQIKLTVGSTLFGIVVAVAVFFWWWRGVYAAASFLVWYDHSHYEWITIPLLLIPPLVLVSAFMVMTRGRDRMIDLWCAPILASAVIAIGFVAQASTMDIEGTAAAKQYQLICEHRIAGHTAHYSVSGVTSNARIKHAEALLNNNTSIEGDFRSARAWSAEISIDKDSSCGYVEYQLKPTRAAINRPDEWEAIVSCRISLDGHSSVVDGEYTHNGNHLSGGCRAP